MVVIVVVAWITVVRVLIVLHTIGRVIVVHVTTFVCKFRVLIVVGHKIVRTVVSVGV